MGTPQAHPDKGDIIILGATCLALGKVRIVVVDLDGFIHAGQDDQVAVYFADGEDDRLTTVSKGDLSNFKVHA